MSAVESALDVLSRAATMVQEERPKTSSLHRKPSSAWRKERRRDPIQSEALDMSAARVHHHARPSVIVPTTPQPGTTVEDTPVTACTATASAATGAQRTGVRNTGVVCDPAIDEHFKRSLGLEEYAAVFDATSSNDKAAGLSAQLMTTLPKPLERRGPDCRRLTEARIRLNPPRRVRQQAGIICVDRMPQRSFSLLETNDPTKTNAAHLHSPLLLLDR